MRVRAIAKGYYTYFRKVGTEFHIDSDEHFSSTWMEKVEGASAPDAEPEETATDPLDHDGDGKPGGSVSAGDSEELKALRAEYKEVVGKKPFAGWDADTLRAKIAEANEE